MVSLIWPTVSFAGLGRYVRFKSVEKAIYIKQNSKQKLFSWSKRKISLIIILIIVNIYIAHFTVLRTYVNLVRSFWSSFIRKKLGKTSRDPHLISEAEVWTQSVTLSSVILFTITLCPLFTNSTDLLTSISKVG